MAMSSKVALYERRQNGLPSTRTSTGPLGKRILLNRWTWVFVLMTLVYAGCLLFQYRMVTAPVKIEGGEVEGINFSAVRDAAKLAFPTLLFWIVAYAWLDRFRPQRPLVWWLALGWGGSVATAMSIVINTWAALEMQVTGGADPSQGARSAIFVAPFVEEAAKASVLFGIAIAYRYRLVSKVSGIVLAGLSAAGFAFTENIIYYARAIVFTSTTISAGDPDQAINTLVMLRGVWLAFGHPLFTTMTGIGVLVAVRTHSKVVRVLAPLVGYLAASLLHMAFNTAATFFSAGSQGVFLYFLVIIPLVLAVVIWILRQLIVESRRHRDRLADFVRMGWLTDADAYVFSRQRSRTRAALIAATRGWACLVATLRLQHAVTELVYLRDAQVRGTVDAAGDVRAHELLAPIRQLKATAVSDPRGRRLNLPDVRAFGARLRALAGQLPWRRRATVPPQSGPYSGGTPAPVGSPAYSPVDPRWGPPTS